MADSKISALTAATAIADSDDFALASGGASLKAAASLLKAYLTGADGWIDDTAETWTYASGSGGGTATFTVTGDLTAKYTKGTRIKLTQTTVKYFVVAASSVSSGTTTVTITAGSSYTLANAAISANFHSYMANPQGYPGWFNFAPSLTGFSGTPTVNVARFMVIGNTCFIKLDGTGTSDATTAGFTAPISTTSQTNNDMAALAVTNNSLSLAQPGDAYLSGAGTVWGVYRDSTGTSWTNSGTKAFRIYGSFEF